MIKTNKMIIVLECYYRNYHTRFIYILYILIMPVHTWVSGAVRAYPSRKYATAFEMKLKSKVQVPVGSAFRSCFCRTPTGQNNIFHS